MKRKETRRITALLLTTALCVGLCTGLTANAGEPDAEFENQTEQMGEIPREDISSEELTGEAETKETEEPEPKTSEETDQEAAGASEEPEAESLPEISGESEVQEADDQQEGQEDGQSGEAELSEETERKLSARASEAGLSDPKIEANSGMTAKQKVTWDCVWFGSYPQSEVTSSDPLYSTLQNASGWDVNNDITLNGNRYRRMKKGDATYTSTSSVYYSWSDSTTWHYFKYEPIKWRVLKINGNQALLLSELALDDQKYHTVYESVTWETSTIRSWLNGYGSASNQQGTDYSKKNFIGSAFTSGERSAIVNTSVVNADNIIYGTTGGNDTKDQVFLLSESEVYGASAASHGFVSDRSIYDEARRCKSSTYAKAMGVSSDTSDAYKGNCHWWLRSPGSMSSHAVDVYSHGSVDDDGSYVGHNDHGVRAALNLNLSSNQWSSAGTVCSDGTGNETGSDVGGEDASLETDYESEVVSFMKNKGTLNTIKYLCKDSNFTNSIHVRENDATFGSSITMILSDVYYRGLDGWKDLFTAATSKEDAEKILAALLQEYQTDVEELAMAKNAKKYAGYFVKGLKDYTTSDAIISSLNDKDIKKLSNIITEEKVAELLVNGKYETLSAYFQKEGGYSANSEIVKTLDGYMQSKTLASQLSKGLDFLGDGLTILSLTQDTFHYICQLESLVDADEIYSEMLLYLKGNCCYSVVQDAAADLYRVIHGSYIKQLDYVSSALKNAAVDKALDLALDRAVSAIPCGKIIKAGFDWGVNLSNVIFHTGDTQQLKDSMRTVAYIGNCLSAWTIDNQREFLMASTGAGKNEYARKLYYSLYMLWNTRKTGEETLQSMYTKAYMKWSKFYTMSLQVSSTLDSLKESIFTDRMKESIISVTVSCPVDVEVYNASGKLAATVKDGKESSGCIDDLYYYVKYQKLDEDYVKILCFPENSGYTLKYVGKNIGTVDSEIRKLTEEGGTERKYFENTAIQKNTVITVTPAASGSQAYTITDPSTGKVSEESFKPEPEEYIPAAQLKLVENKIKMTVGSKRLFTVHFQPENTTEKKTLWKSSNNAVASVNSDGVITAKSAGKCTVQCTAVSDSRLQSTAEIEVSAGQTGNGTSGNTEVQGSGTNKSPEKAPVKKIKVSKIKISGISRNIAAGKKIKLTAKVTSSNAGNKAVTWKSSNKKVATVNSKGVVTLKKNSGGKKVTITATAKDGSKRKASYKITSMKGTVKKVVISGKKTRTLKAGKTLKLKAKVTASNAKKANKTLKWSSSNTKYATVTSAGKVRTKKAGKGKTVKITAAATDGSNKKATVKVKLK